MVAPGTPLRVTVVSPFGVIGGAELWLLRLLDAAEELAVSAVLLRDGPLRRELESRAIGTTVLDVGPGGRDLVRAWPVLARLLREDRPDVVVGNGVKAQAALGPVPFVLRIGSVWVKHDHSFDRLLTPVLARAATAVVATAEDLVPATGRRDVVVLHPPRPVDAPLPRSEAAATLAELAGTRPPRTLVMSSRLTRYKGIDAAIEALALGAAEWHLVVLGGEDPAEPGERQRLLDLAERLGVSSRVHLVGHVDGASRLLSGSDALAVLTRRAGPRTPAKEGFGMAAMEAMLAGVPVLAPDDGGPVARRAASGSGVLVDATDPNSVAAALAELTPARCAALGDVGRRQAETAFAPASVAARTFTEVLRSAAARRGRTLRDREPRCL